MKRRNLSMAVVGLALGLGGCVTSPKQTVLNLDTTDRRWTSRKCVAAREQVYQWDDQHGLKTVVGVAGNLVVPFAGTAGSLAITAGQRREREALNRQVLAACVTPPKHRREPRRASGSRLHRLMAKGRP